MDARIKHQLTVESNDEPSDSRRGPSEQILDREGAGFRNMARDAFLHSWQGQAVDRTLTHFTPLGPPSEPGGGSSHPLPFAD